ncbi:MAG: hypothetical protein ACR2FS_01975 [Phormidesmis sp.]
MMWLLDSAGSSMAKAVLFYLDWTLLDRERSLLLKYLVTAPQLIELRIQATTSKPMLRVAPVTGAIRSPINPPQTYLSCEKASNHYSLLTIALCWAVKVGQWLNKSQPLLYSESGVLR